MGKILRFATLLVAIQGLFACGKHNQRLLADDVYIFSSFRGNGEDGLHLAYSQDGLNWQPLNKDQSVLTPQIGGKLLRDPCIILGPDNIFHMVWTTGWEDKGIGLAHSSDLIDWSEQKYLPVMADFPTARNAWAPEITWDELTQQYFIYWASTIPGTYAQTEASADKGWDHRIFATTTKDFVHYTPTKLFYQPDFNVIDATIAKVANHYVMIVKDETRYPPAKNLLVATGPSIEGPWLLNANPFSPKDTWVEGPSILTSHEGHYVYFDQYTEHRYGAMYTKDFQQWQDVSEHLVMPEGSRHGSALRVSAVQFNALQQLR